MEESGVPVFYGSTFASSIEKEFDRNTSKYHYIVKTDKLIFKCESLVLATGANQTLPEDLKDEFCLMPHCKVYSSSHVLQSKGLDELVSSIKKV